MARAVGGRWGGGSQRVSVGSARPVGSKVDQELKLKKMRNGAQSIGWSEDFIVLIKFIILIKRDVKECLQDGLSCSCAFPRPGPVLHLLLFSLLQQTHISSLKNTKNFLGKFFVLKYVITSLNFQKVFPHVHISLLKR